jgi:hypothetical protein
MKARILLLASFLSLCSCSKPPVSLGGSAIDTQPDEPRPPEATVYLLRRIAVATEDTLWGFKEGTEAKLIEERSQKLLVQIEGVQFELNRDDVTSDLEKRDAVLARASERETVRLTATQRAEDRKFLAEDDAKRRTFTKTKIAQLQNAIRSAREEIARLQTEFEAAASRAERHGILIPMDGVGSSSNNSAENAERLERIVALQTHIADCDREIQMLSDAVTGGD